MRLELFFKTGAELQGLITLLHQSSPSITAINLTNKQKTDPLLQSISTIRKALPSIDVVPHFSLKFQYKLGDAEATYQHTKSFIQSVADLGVREVLVVTGSGPRKQLDSLSCLQRLASDPSQPLDQPSSSSPVRLGVAFNPYLPQPQALEEERQRLKAKVETGLVSSIWLQIGSDLQALQQGLDFLEATLQEQQKKMNENQNKEQREEERRKGRTTTRLIGSILIPSKKMLAQMKFRPWNGVFLSHEYLSEVAAADAITKQILDLYRTYDVEPLVETAVKREADLCRVKEVLGDLYRPSSGIPPHTPSTSHNAGGSTIIGSSGLSGSKKRDSTNGSDGRKRCMSTISRKEEKEEGERGRPSARNSTRRKKARKEEQK